MSSIKMKSIAVLSIMLFLSSMVFIPVNAYVQTLIPQDDYSMKTGQFGSGEMQSPPQYRNIKHSSGKYVVLVIDGTDGKMHIQVISSTGTILNNSPLSAVTAWSGDPSIIEYDADEVLLTFGGISGTKSVSFYRFNIVTFQYSGEYRATMGSVNGADATYRVSYPIRNPSDGYFYVIAGATSYYNGDIVGVCVFTGSAATHTDYALNMDNYAFRVMGYLDVTAQLIYFAFSKSGTVNCYVYSISAKTLTSIAASPFADGYASYGCYTAGYGQETMNLGSGVYVDGTDSYLYFAWSYAERYGVWGGATGTRYTGSTFWYMKFNSSISSATLVKNQWITDIDLDSSGSSSSSTGLSAGYMFHNPTTPTFDINIYYQDIYNGKYVSRSTKHITDITTEPTAYDTENVLQGVDDQDFDFISIDCMMSFDPIYGTSYQQITNTNNRFVYGGSILARVYTFTQTYNPVDTPLNALKEYTYTTTVYLNGVLDTLGTDTYKVFVGGIEKKTGTLGINGIISMQMTVSEASTQLIIVKIYDAGILVGTSSSYSYTYIANTTPDDDETTTSLIALGTSLALNYLPAALVIFGTGTTLATTASKIGAGNYAMTMFLSGCCLGCILGGMTGIVSQSMMILGLLVFALMAVYVFKMPSGGGGGQ